MRTSTILGISISLATGIVLGWGITNVKSDLSHTLPQDELKSMTHVSLHPIKMHPSLDALSKEALSKIDVSNEMADDELASLLLADSMLAKQNTEDYVNLRKAWEGKERELARWTLLDAQERIIEGNPNEAAFLLQGYKFKGRDEAERLTRLAALYVVKDPKKAWSYLNEAVNIDPENSDLRTFRASLAESLGRNETAESEYITALQKDPTSPERHEQLAEFYIRTKQYGQALKILQGSMQAPSNDGIWLKTLFWSRVAMPLAKTWGHAPVPDGPLKDFIVYLKALPEGIFWDEAAFNQIPNRERFLDTLQETFWLKILGELKNQSDAESLDRIKQNPFSLVSWAPKLEKALVAILNFRKAMQDRPKGMSLYARASDIDSPAALVTHLVSLSELPSEELPSKIPLDLYDYLLSENAFTIPFLAEGWTEAAIYLHPQDSSSSSIPGWVTAAFAAALQQNRGAAKALAFASTQSPSPELSLAVAEIALAADDKQTAFKALKEVYTTNSEQGQKAALMLGEFLMEHHNLKDAKRALEAQPTLLDNPAAKEILARIAVQENDIGKATKLYSELQTHSSEAKSFLACQAYAEKNWKRARELTEALLEEYPENQVLIDNLKKIIAEESRSQRK